MQNVIDHVFLTPRAYVAWKEHVKHNAVKLPRGVVVPDEAAEVMPDGTLRIHVTSPTHGVMLEMTVPPSDWKWAT